MLTCPSICRTANQRGKTFFFWSKLNSTNMQITYNKLSFLIALINYTGGLVQTLLTLGSFVFHSACLRMKQSKAETREGKEIMSNPAAFQRPHSHGLPHPFSVTMQLTHVTAVHISYPLPLQKLRKKGKENGTSLFF